MRISRPDKTDINLDDVASGQLRLSLRSMTHHYEYDPR